MNTDSKTALMAEVATATLKQRVRRAAATSLIIVALLAAAACSKTKATSQPLGPPEVEVATVEQKDGPIYSEGIGTLDGIVNAEIKSQVTGYLLNKNYTEGSFVRKGQLMFEIDP